MDEMLREEITIEERGYLGIMRLNALLSKDEIRRKWAFGRLDIEFRWRSKRNLWGRFGGGWNWELGFQASGRTVILMLLICTLRLDWRPS